MHGDPEPQKAALVRILEILKYHSDSNNILEQNDIIDYLREDHGIEVERKTIARCLKTLEQAGYPVIISRRGSYFDEKEREFNDLEIRLLIDSVLSSRHISPRQSKDIIDKLCGLSNKFFRNRVKHIHTMEEWTKGDNSGLFWNIEYILNAIDEKKKIRFTMNSYGIDKKLHPGREHIVSPLKLLMKEQCYYLLCVERLEGVDPEYDEPIVRMLAVDMLSDIKITGKKAEKHKISEESYEQLFREHSEMESFFFDEAEYITFVCPEARIEKVIAAFGKNVRIAEFPTPDHKELSSIYFSRSELKLIKVTVKTTYYAARQFVQANAPFTTVLKPERLKNIIQRNMAGQRKFAMIIEDEVKEAEERNKKK